MPTEIDVQGLKDLLSRTDIQLVEVLPAQEFEEEHLPGAVNIPLKSVTRESVAILDPNKAIVVYCWDDV